LIGFFTPPIISNADCPNDLTGAMASTSDRLGNEERQLPHVQNGRLVGSQMQREDAPPLEREQLPAANRTAGQYQLDWEGTFFQLLAQI